MKPSVSAFLACAAIAGATPAFAQSDVEVREYNKRFEEGEKLFKQGNFAEARVKFLQSCAARKTRFCSKNLGVTEYKLGMFPDAATHLEEYVADEGSRGDANLARVRKMLDESLAKSGHLTIDAPAGATVAIDDQPVGKAPFAAPIHIAPGTHAVRAALVSGNMLAVTISIEAGKTTVASLKEPATAPAPPPVASAPAPPVAAAAPSASATTSPPPNDMPASPPFMTTRRWIGVGVTAAGLIAIGAGAVFASKSNDASDQAAALQASVGRNGCASNPSPQCAQLADAYSTQDSNHTLNLVFTGFGIAAAVTGVVLFVWPDSKPRSVTAAPLVSPTGGGLQVHGAF